MRLTIGRQVPRLVTLVATPLPLLAPDPDGAGGLASGGIRPSGVPPGVPSGARLSLQASIADAAGPGGYTTSNGPNGTAP
jgi:hypothetical protein